MGSSLDLELLRPLSAGGQALNSTVGTRAGCGTQETDPAVLALYHEECNATDLEVWTALPLDISRTGVPSRNLIIHGYTVKHPFRFPGGLLALREGIGTSPHHARSGWCLVEQAIKS